MLLRTGWLEAQKGVKHVSFDTEPGIDVEAARWLAEREVAVVGADNFAVEVLPFTSGAVFPVHQLLIRDFGVPLDLGGLAYQTFIRARAQYGGGAMSTQAVKLLEDALHTDLRAAGFPDEL